MGELAAGRIIGPIAAEFRDRIQVRRFGVIPKPHQPGKWRLITDLSSPGGPGAAGSLASCVKFTRLRVSG